MLDKEKYQKQINHIRDLAKQHKKTPQKLVSRFVHLIDDYSLDGYSMTLVEATENTNIELHNGFTVMTGHSTQYTELMDKDFVKMTAHDSGLGDDAKQAWDNWQKNIPRFDKYATCNISLNKAKSTPNLNYYNHDFHPVTYDDIVGLVKRFYAVKSTLDNQGQGMEVHPTDIVKILQHAQRIAKHGYLKEALNLVQNVKVPDDAREIIDKNLDKSNFVKSVSNAIISLRKALFEYNTVVNEYTKDQKKVIHTLKHIDFSNVNKGLDQLNIWLYKNSSKLEDYGYDFYNNRAKNEREEHKMLDVVEPDAAQLKKDENNWAIKVFNNRAKKSYCIASSAHAKSELYDYAHSGFDVPLTNEAKNDYHKIKDDQYYVFPNYNLDPEKNFKYRKATKNDAKVAIQNMISCFHLSANLLHVFSEWQKKLVKAKGLSHIKKEMESLQNENWTLQGDVFNSILDGMTDDLLSMKENPPFSIKKVHSITGMIVDINDMKGYIKDYMNGEH